MSYANRRDSKGDPTTEYTQWPATSGGDIEEGVWTEVTPAVFDEDGNETTPAVWDMVVSTRKLTAEERAAWDAAEAAALVPDISDDEARKTVAILSEDAFYLTYAMQAAVQKFAGALVAAGVIPAEVAEAAALSDAEKVAIKDGVRDTLAVFEADPGARDAYVDDRVRKTRRQGQR